MSDSHDKGIDEREPTASEGGVKVSDKRRFLRPDADVPEEAGGEETGGEDAEGEELRRRASAAEDKLREFQTAFVRFRDEQEQTRRRLERDVERKAEIRFGDLVADLLESVDDLDRALEHGAAVAGAEPLAKGVALARDRFLSALAKAGIERLDPTGAAFDPNFAEGVGIAPVEAPEQNDTVVRTVRAGYRLGERVIRPARVVVGRLLS